jgi:hypothetical protein
LKNKGPLRRPIKIAGKWGWVTYSREDGTWISMHFPEDEPMPERVDLAKSPFPLLLSLHFQRRSTGTLEVTSGPYRKLVYLKDGQAVFAASNDHNDRLGEMLVRRGSLKLPDYLASSATISSGKRFGTILVERGLLSPSQLVWAVKEQVKEIVFSLFSLPGGMCQLIEGPAGEGEIITLNINTPELLRQGVARMENVTWLLDSFNDQAARLGLTRPSAEILALFSLDPQEVDLVHALEGTPTLAELCAAGPISHFLLLKFLWSLQILGFVAVRRPVDEAVPDLSAPSESLPTPEDIEITGDDLKGLF